MMPDVNVLVAAFRADHAQHEVAHAELAGARQDRSQGSGSLTLLPMVLTGFLRLGTCGDQWPLLRDKLLSLGLKGNMVTDAWIATTVEACAEHVATFDRDFARLLPARDLTLLSLKS
ncbi:MAG TPA: hypothetical protein VN279_01130 [Rhodocyclaceae bacterium]|jgi:hypothetical protein|nr:hypothetical protein [Rhodocyclaceae bacterium]